MRKSVLLLFGPGVPVGKMSIRSRLRFICVLTVRPHPCRTFIKKGLLKLCDQRITQDGIIIIKAQRFRTQEKNREDALSRLVELIQKAGAVQKARRPTKPTRASRNPAHGQEEPAWSG